MLEQHRTMMNGLLKHFKAEKKEFLSILRAHLEVHGSPSLPGGVNNEETEPAIMYKGKNLLAIYAPEMPSLFGRELGRVLFGEGAACELTRTLIGAASNRKEARKACDEVRFNLFKGLFSKALYRNFSQH